MVCMKHGIDAWEESLRRRDAQIHKHRSACPTRFLQKKLRRLQRNRETDLAPPEDEPQAASGGNGVLQEIDRSRPALAPAALPVSAVKRDFQIAALDQPRHFICNFRERFGHG